MIVRTCSFSREFSSFVCHVLCLFHIPYDFVSFFVSFYFLDVELPIEIYSSYVPFLSVSTLLLNL